ncbi:hypothetical protein MTP10_37185 [Nonomuraea sp. 3-1Str]|uniref:hypothetical protein n=1 Tax=Nonomuraea sp. 3-1Str TaxID=2929801 RepID=UPI00286622C9|nr:hypothetical protein [Nonomuraea sp. 3-1Str]MDR8414352.1 hypothetical protein [Nonomuraea sp. 3-1Str]
MDVLLFNVTTAALLVLMFTCARTLVGPETAGRRPIPWAAVGLTAVAVAGVAIQASWHGAMAALDADPSKTGWWRGVTSVFMQNGGVSGAAWNIVTLAVIAVLAAWFWSGPLMLALFLAGALLPEHIDALLGLASDSTDPRNFAGSSGATYFLAATLAGALLLRARAPKERLLALAAPALGLALWFAQDNGHGLVAVYGFAVGALVWAVVRPLRQGRAVPA